jgi:hypothetical protein
MTSKIEKQTDCTICVNSFNRSSRKSVKCAHCQIECCVECCKKYLSESKEGAHCMACKKPWDRMFLSNNFPKKWIHKEYKIHRENLMEERHDAKLHTYQPHIVSKNRAHGYRVEIFKLNKEALKIRHKMRNLDLWARNEEAYYNGSRPTQPEPRDLLERRLNKEDIKKLEEESKERKEKLMKQRGPCPKESCKGFIADNWECGVCNSKVCSSCMLDISVEIDGKITKLTDHTCDPNDVESAKQIRKDSKNCPGCRVRIYKIQGCSQMFCTICHVFFDWNTLEVIRHGFVHNPHYADYVATNGTAAVTENICGQRNLRFDEFKVNVDETLEDRRYKKILSTELRMVYETMDSNRYERQRSDMEDLERELGIRYLENSISKEARRKLLQRKKKEMDKLNDTVNVRELWCDQVYTYIHNYIKSDESIEVTKTSIDKIYKYCENSMKDIGMWYNSKAPSVRARGYGYGYH